MSRLSLVRSISSLLSSMDFQSFRTVSTTDSMDNESLIEVERLVEVVCAKRLSLNDAWLWHKHKAKWSSMTRQVCAMHSSRLGSSMGPSVIMLSLTHWQRVSKQAGGDVPKQVQLRFWNQAHGVFHGFRQSLLPGPRSALGLQPARTRSARTL